MEKITQIPPLAPRQLSAHKGDFGRIAIVGGSSGMIGAPALAARAALRSGAGLVRIATPGSIQLTTASLELCATTIALAEDAEGRISQPALAAIMETLVDNNAAAIGPGMGQSNQLRGIMECIVKSSDKPLVIDADGLNNLAGLGGIKLSGNIILTPHPGEAARLWSAYVRESLPAERAETAERLARYSGAIVVLKGYGTIVTNGSQTYINQSGNPGMATAGAGDVLTGCIAALAGTSDVRLDPLHAAILGVYVHGLAGDLAAKVLGETSLTASDIVNNLSGAFKILETGNEI